MRGNRSGRKPLARLLAAIGLVAVAGASGADDYPSKPITIVVAYAAGGGTDLLVRTLVEPLQQALGQQILVQNTPGAGGGVAAVKVKGSAADGYTFIATTSSTFTLEPQVQKTAYQLDDFTHVGTLAQFQGAIFTRADKPFSTWPELVAHVKAEKRPIKYASFFMLD